MNLRQLHQFVTLAETGNFRRAAERLHMAQPPLSVSMRKLEDDLGSALLLRTGAGVLLTDAGQALLPHARSTLAHAAQCRQAVAQAAHGEGGTLRLGIIGSATYALLPQLIPSLRRRHPRITLELTEATSAEILVGLQARRFDAGLVRYPQPDPRGFALLPLDRDEFVLAVPSRGWLARLGAQVALSQAAHEPFIMYPQDKVPGVASLAMQRCQLSGFVPRVEQEATQVQTILSLVATGLGVALVAGVARRLAPSGVKCLRLSDNPPGFQLGIALAHLAGEPGPLVQRLAEHALQMADVAGNADLQAKSGSSRRK